MPFAPITPAECAAKIRSAKKIAVLTGAGKCFSAGADIKNRQAVGDIRVISATALALPLASHFVSRCDRMAEL